MTLNERLRLLRDCFEDSADRRELLRSGISSRSDVASDIRGQQRAYLGSEEDSERILAKAFANLVHVLQHGVRQSTRTTSVHSERY